MNLIQALWKDESGLIMSAEVVTLGTVGVLGAVVGLSAAGTAVNGELKEMASAFRSLDQSYGYLGHRGCRAWTAGSCYIQPDVQQSLAEINGDGAVDIRAIQQSIEEERKGHSQSGLQSQPRLDPTSSPTPLPNQIPSSETKKALPEVKSTPEPTVVPAKP